MSSRIERVVAHERRRAGENALSDFAEYVEKKQQSRPQPEEGHANQDDDGYSSHDELDILESLGLSDKPIEVPLKSILLDATDEGREKLKELISNRIKEGRGETMFDVGTENNLESMKLTKAEYELALKSVREIAQQLNAGVTILMTKNTGEETDVATPGSTDASAKVLIRPKPNSIDELLEIRVAVVGNGMDTGTQDLNCNAC